MAAESECFATALDRVVAWDAKMMMDIKPELKENPWTEETIIISIGQAMIYAKDCLGLHACTDVIRATVGTPRAAEDSG